MVLVDQAPSMQTGHGRLQAVVEYAVVSCHLKESRDPREAGGRMDGRGPGEVLESQDEDVCSQASKRAV